MGKIVITVVPGDYPVIEINGECLDTKYTPISRLAGDIIRTVSETSGLKNNLLEVCAWGGKITGHTNAVPPQNLHEAISFDDIVLRKMSGNTREPHLIDRIFPIMALLFWQQNERFLRLKQSHIFKCLVCGATQLSSSNHIIPPIPDFCTSPQCFSHGIKNMLGTTENVSDNDVSLLTCGD